MEHIQRRVYLGLHREKEFRVHLRAEIDVFMISL
jgi:hypothetical protein